MKKKIFKIAYVSAFIVLFALPGVTSFVKKNKSIGNEEKKTLKGANYTTFSDKFDDYFSSEFGFRNELVDINNTLKYAMFKQSGSEEVIVGKDGWYFYESALHDYIGEDVLSDAQIKRAVKILSMASAYTKEQGADFVFASAPNKMEIYADYMPYYCMENTEDGNYEKLYKELANSSVMAVDLKAILKAAASKADIVYHKEDSHWNNLGASIAYNAIMKELKKNATDYSTLKYSIKQDFKGDLYAMLFPNKNKLDNQVYFDMADRYYYTSNFKGNDDIIIKTQNDEGSGKLLMFRDSFGNALHTFFANDFAECIFSRALPYDLTSLNGTDTVVLELVERNLKNILLYQPVIEPKQVDEPVAAKRDNEPQVSVYMEDGKARKYASSKVKVIVSSDEIDENCVDLYVKTSDAIVYEAYPTSNKGEACIYIDESKYHNGYIAELLYIE